MTSDTAFFLQVFGSLAKDDDWGKTYRIEIQIPIV